ncbi:SEC14-like protein 2 [Folsomia candida]|uniref:CRAL-TRIO domain-containing protein n=1 Tax=Folsomia candida TaxID=158441 RepID=A0A226DEE4_FOLCA|nr:SEC14-like protein 2 [Folsomia candida]OXA42566.1 hypothetical protein Fcan01_22668 [Folsomia candida]
MSLPTPEEKIAIQKFRGRVEDVLTPELQKDDWFLLRWLRARELNLDKAEAMLRNSMKWRAENKVDLTLSRPVDSYFSSNYPFDISGRDKEGRVLMVLPLGKWDARMAVDDGKVELLVGYINFFFESIAKGIKESSVSAGRPASHPHTQFTCLVDWDGYSFKQFTNIKAAQTVIKMGAVYEAHYPEILAQCIFINTTSVFQLLWALMRKVLAERTVSKIQVFGTNRKEWEPAILKIVDRDQIKTELREGAQISEDELKKIKEAKGISEDDISALIIQK